MRLTGKLVEKQRRQADEEESHGNDSGPGDDGPDARHGMRNERHMETVWSGRGRKQDRRRRSRGRNSPDGKSCHGGGGQKLPRQQ